MAENGTENRLIVIAGPTAVGKTKTAVELAKLLDTEVVSADSMQVYRGMDVGTAKVTEEERQGVPHALINVLDPSEEFNVIRFLEMAKAEIDRIHQKGKIPILCGGTGFYIQALLYGIEFPGEEEDSSFRAEMHRLADEQGPEAVWLRLKEADPEYAEQIPAENVVKCIRGLEFFRSHGVKLSEHNRLESERKAHPVYDTKLFVLYDEREALNERIHRRVDRMMEGGLPEETQKLLAMGIPGSATSMQAIGYRQLADFLSGQMTLDEAVEKIKTASRRYAKRQIVWFKREPEAVWIHVGKTDPVKTIREHLRMWGLQLQEES